MTPPPEWISPESWEAFHESRRKIRAPLTAYAERLIIIELVKLKAAREDPQACLDQSIRLGWRDVFPVRDKGLQQTSTGELARIKAQEAVATKPPAAVLALADQIRMRSGR